MLWSYFWCFFPYIKIVKVCKCINFNNSIRLCNWCRITLVLVFSVSNLKYVVKNVRNKIKLVWLVCNPRKNIWNKVKKNWTGLENFDIYLCVLCDCYGPRHWTQGYFSTQTFGVLMPLFPRILSLKSFGSL